MGEHNTSRSWVRILGVGLGLVACLVGAPQPVGAQASTSSGFVGEVRDESGGVLPGATVTATQVDTGVAQTAVTDEAGRYRVPLLPQGNYTLEAGLEGFQAQVKTGLVLTVGRTLAIDFSLGVGSLTESVEVSGATTLVETQSSSVAGLVSGDQVRDLPLNGRSFDQLITLSPGTVMFSQRTTNAFQGTANQYSAGGVRPNQSRMIVDGSEMSGAGGNHTSVNTASGKLLGVEAIQEFQVVTNNADASYGKKPGGQVSIITRSGTNQFSGSVFGFFRDEAFSARDYFATEKPPLTQRNVGGTVGGPILRNKSFFFTSYESYIEQRGVTAVSTVPTMAVRRGIFPDGSVVPVHPDMAPILAIYPEPILDFGDGTGEARTPAVKDIDDKFFVARLDQQFSSSHSLTGRYMVQTGLRSDPNDNGIGRFLEVVPFDTHLLTVGYKAILSPRLVSQATFTLNKAYNRVDYAPVDGVTIPPSMIVVPGQTHHTSIQVQGGQIPNLGANTAGGTAEQYVDRRVFQFSDKVSYTRGAHYLDIGAEVHRVESQQFSGTQVRGTLRFANLKALVQGIPNQVTGPMSGSDGTKDWLQTYVAGYAQDAYRIRSNLTLNLGLRYEFMSNARDAQGRQGSWTPDPVTLILPTNPTVTSEVFAENKSGNWAPRVGFAWDVFGDSRMALRGGYGIFYAQMESEFRRALGPAAPFYNLATVANPPFPNPGQSLENAALGRLSASAVEPSPTIPRIRQFNLRVERSLGSSLLMAVGYLGSRGSHLGRTTNPQTPPPVINAAGRAELPRYLMNPALNTGATYYVWDAHSRYDAFEAELEQRFSHGLRYKAAFTWSKAIDEGSDIIANLSGASGGSSLLTAPEYGRGLAPHDARRRFVVNWSYNLPLGDHSGVAGAVLDNWQLAGVLQLQDGFPFTVTSGVTEPAVGGVNLNRTRAIDLVDGRSNNPVVGSPEQYYDPTAFQLAPISTIGTLGSNTLIGPGLQVLDLSFIKTVPVKGTSLVFRVDGFNVLNHVNFGFPDTTLFNADGSPRPSAGRITSTTTSGREFQFSVKFVW